MIRDDRVQLNNRFIQVFNLLQERGDVVMNDRSGKGIGDFAQKILGNRGYGHIVRAFLNEEDKRVIDYGHARMICRIYGVNESFLIDGLGTPFGFDILPQSNLPGDSSKRGKGNIIFTTTEAFAGSGAESGGSAREDNEYFSFPGLTGSGLVAFPVEGNSMDPVIMHGDIVICREINGLHEIKDNEIYAVKHNGKMWIKYVQKTLNKKGHVTGLTLISANNLEFHPFDAEVNEQTRLYKLVRRVSHL